MNISSLGSHTEAYSEKASTLLATLLKQTKKLKTEVTEEMNYEDKEGRVEEGPAAAHNVPIPIGDVKTKELKTEVKDNDDKEVRVEEAPAHKVPIPMGDETNTSS